MRTCLQSLLRFSWKCLAQSSSDYVLNLQFFRHISFPSRKRPFPSLSSHLPSSDAHATFAFHQHRDVTFQGQILLLLFPAPGPSLSSPLSLPLGAPFSPTGASRRRRKWSGGWCGGFLGRKRREGRPGEGIESLEPHLSVHIRACLLFSSLLRPF